jgi:hypothetical protein
VRSKPLALALILLTFFGTSTPWHIDDADTGQVVLVAHDHSAHHEALRAPSAASAPTHCALCHWLQSFRAGSVRQARIPFETSVRVAHYTAIQTYIRGIDPSQSPSRAPPA